MIVLLGCSINLSANNTLNDSIHSSTGERENQTDSVLIAYDDLRIANSKLIELQYEQDINDNLRNIIANDSILIKDYKVLNEKLDKSYKKAIRQRNIGIGASILFFITSLILIFK